MVRTSFVEAQWRLMKSNDLLCSCSLSSRMLPPKAKHRTKMNTSCSPKATESGAALRGVPGIDHPWLLLDHAAVQAALQLLLVTRTVGKMYNDISLFVKTLKHHRQWLVSGPKSNAQICAETGASSWYPRGLTAMPIGLYTSWNIRMGTSIN